METILRADGLSGACPWSWIELRSPDLWQVATLISEDGHEACSLVTFSSGVGVHFAVLRDCKGPELAGIGTGAAVVLGPDIGNGSLFDPSAVTTVSARSHSESVSSAYRELLPICRRVS